MVFIAAGLIVWTAIQRLVDPVPLDQAGIGLALSTGASLINLAVGASFLRRTAPPIDHPHRPTASSY